MVFISLFFIAFGCLIIIKAIIKPDQNLSKIIGTGIVTILIGWYLWPNSVDEKKPIEVVQTSPDFSPGGIPSSKKPKVEQTVYYERSDKVKADSIERSENVKKLFSGWDGSDIALVKHVKENMNDPDSFEHVNTTYYNFGDTILIHMKFRGNNVYGGKVLNTIRAKQRVKSQELFFVSNVNE